MTVIQTIIDAIQQDKVTIYLTVHPHLYIHYLQSCRWNKSKTTWLLNFPGGKRKIYIIDEKIYYRAVTENGHEEVCGIIPEGPMREIGYHEPY